MLNTVLSDSCAADCHGFLCGQICVADFPVHDIWEEYLDLKTEDESLMSGCLNDIDGLVSETISFFESAEFEFHPLLPDDTTPLADRISALSEWRHGF